MPTLPIYDRQRQLDVRMPQPAQASQAHVKEAKEASQNLQAVGGVMQTAAIEWKKASDIMDYTKGKNDLTFANNEVIQNATLDPDFKNADKYIDQLKSNKTVAMKSIRNPRIAEAAGVEFDHDIKIAQLKIDGIFKQKEITQYKQNTDNLIEDLNEKYPQLSVDERNKQVTDLLGFIEVAHNMGAYDESEYHDKLKIMEDLELNRAIYNTGIDPDGTMAMVKEGKEYNLTESQKATYWSQAFDIKKKVKERDEQLKEYNEGKGALKAATMMAENTLTPVALGQMVQNKEITDELAVEFFKAISSTFEVPNDTAVADGYIKILEALAKTKPKAMDAILATVEAFGNKIIPKDQMAYFLQQADEILENIGKPPKPSFWKTIGDKLKAIGYGIPPVAAYNAFQSFFNKKLEGKKDSQAMNEVENEALIAKDPSLITSDDPKTAAYQKQALSILKSGGADDLSQKAIDEVAEQLRYADDKGLQVYIANTKEKQE